jgi:hypothetical protein
MVQHPLLAVKHLKEFVGTSYNFLVQQHFLTGSFAWSGAFDFFYGAIGKAVFQAYVPGLHNCKQRISEEINTPTPSKVL